MSILQQESILQQDGIPVFGSLTGPIFVKLPCAHIFLIFVALPTPHYSIYLLRYMCCLYRYCYEYLV